LTPSFSFRHLLLTHHRRTDECRGRPVRFMFRPTCPVPSLLSRVFKFSTSLFLRPGFSYCPFYSMLRPLCAFSLAALIPGYRPSFTSIGTFLYIPGCPKFRPRCPFLRFVMTEDESFIFLLSYFSVRTSAFRMLLFLFLRARVDFLPAGFG